jgi:hypothetical protein
MGKNRFAFAAALCLSLLPRAALCKDFPESVLEADPLAAASSAGLPAGMGASLEYGNYFLAHDDYDSFYFRLGASPVLFAAGDRFALGGVFESILMCAPVLSDEVAANIAAFWMDVARYEYGLYGSLALGGGGKGGFRLLAEYSRTSQHPFINRPEYSQVATDILMLGLSFPEIRRGPFSALSYLRLGHEELFPFWQSGLPESRASWTMKTALEATLSLGRGLVAVARAYPELFIDRYEGILDADIFFEAGLGGEKGRDSAELLLSLFATRDSELLAGRANPLFEAGLAIRYSYGR